MDKASLVKKIQQKFGLKAEPWTDQPDEIDPDKFFPEPNRSEKRLHYKERSKGGTGSVHDALRLGPNPSRAKRSTGQPHWFRIMRYEQERRKALEKVTLDRLEPAVGQVAMDLFHAGYKNVWQLTQVEDVNELLRVGRQTDIAHGIRSKELKHLREYLVQQRVPVKWVV